MKLRDGNYYGTRETNGLHFRDADERDEFLDSFAPGQVDWNDPRLKRVNRLRLLSDPGLPFWDVSYCWGILEDGTRVEVYLPFDQLPKRGWKKAIVEYAKADKVYAKGLGILDNVSTLC